MAIIEKFEQTKQVISKIRSIRKEKNIKNTEPLKLFARIIKENYDNTFDDIIKKLANIQEITLIQDKIDNAISFVIKNVEYFLPLEGLVNVEEELQKLEKELKHLEGFLASVMKKLSNEKFVQNAPAQVVERERKKKADAEAKIKALREQIERLKKS